MAESQFLSKEIIARLQTVQKDLQKRSKTSEKSKQADSALKEFLETSGSKLEFKAGEILFLQDDLGEGMYWIESGQLVVLQGDLDDPQLLTFRFPGQVVGEIALLEDVQRSASVAAMTATRLRYLSKEKFQTFLTHIPGFGVELMRLLSARLREIKPAEYSAGMYDHLTGALSRQAFDIRLGEEMERTQIYQSTFCLVFLDLDRFKDINDTFGHARGDEVLISFVKSVKANLRNTDLLFRYGGCGSTFVPFETGRPWTCNRHITKAKGLNYQLYNWFVCLTFLICNTRYNLFNTK